MNVNHSLKKYMICAVVAVVLLIASVFTVFRPLFTEIQPETGDFVLTATGEKSQQSFGSEVRIREIQINGNPVDLIPLAQTKGWQMDDGMLAAYNVTHPISVTIPNVSAETISVTVVGQCGSGFLNLDLNNYHEECDLYQIEWKEDCINFLVVEEAFIPLHRFDILICIWVILFCMVAVVSNILASIQKINYYNKSKEIGFASSFVFPRHRKTMLIIFVAVIGAYMIFLQPHFSSDTYINIQQIDTSVHLRNGRIVAYFIQCLMNALGFNFLKCRLIISCFYIATVAFSAFKIVAEIYDDNPDLTNIDQTIILCGILLVYINVFFAEWFLYVESFTTSIVGIIVTTFATVSVSKGTDRKYVLIGFLLLFTSLNIYQIYVGLYLILSLGNIYIKNNGNLTKQAFIHSTTVTAIGAVASIGNIVLMSLLQSFGFAEPTNRNIQMNFDHFISNIRIISKSQSSIWVEGYGLLPDKALLIFACVLLISIVMCCIVYHRSIKDIIYIVLLVLCAVGITYIPHVLAGVVWMPPRTLIGIFAILCLLTWIFSVIGKNINVKKMCLLLCIVFIAVNFYNIQGIAVNNIATNKLDANRAVDIHASICHYEQKTGTMIQKIGIVYDKNPQYGYPGIDYITHDMNIKALTISWADAYMINYICGTNYEKVDVPDSIYDKYFKDRDWENFDPYEQIVFVDDAAYLAVY